MKSLAKFAVLGVSGIVLFKLFATILFPLLGLLFGLLAMTVKLALIAAVVFFVYSMIKKRRCETRPEVEVGP
jgi:uncharacterized membrane protein